MIMCFRLNYPKVVKICFKPPPAVTFKCCSRVKASVIMFQ